MIFSLVKSIQLLELVTTLYLSNLELNFIDVEIYEVYVRITLMLQRYFPFT
jgi:hypothetical protein